MTITYTAPVPQNALTTKKLTGFSSSLSEKKILCIFEVGYLNGGGAFVKVKEERRTFTPETTPDFNSFIANCPAGGQLRRQVEIYETTLDKPGTVD